MITTLVATAVEEGPYMGVLPNVRTLLCAQ